MKKILFVHFYIELMNLLFYIFHPRENGKKKKEKMIINVPVSDILI